MSTRPLVDGAVLCMHGQAWTIASLVVPVDLCMPLGVDAGLYADLQVKFGSVSMPVQWTSEPQMYDYSMALATYGTGNECVQSHILVFYGFIAVPLGRTMYSETTVSPLSCVVSTPSLEATHVCVHS
ncbi:hypothetical protein AMTR_s00223p00019260 [Amborella trichopoda]|uniref:Uncharacterized protein n=1 Tax=Amborella trichopoda TaxID=13333 RepID=W1NQX7_AMBTC|nr:hypothetical protein AMTR_s00223p00019260 [Amborella trichopoda]